MAQGQWKEIMIDGRWHPSGVGGVALHTVGWEIYTLMIGVLRHRIVIHMAGKTVGRYIAEITNVMTHATILNVVAFSERKEIVQNILGVPAKA